MTMKERPILFSGPMVRLILDGRKIQTRRVVKFKGPWLNPLPIVDYARDGMPIWFSAVPTETIRQSDYFDKGYPCPFGRVGDRLWVRETWGTINDGMDSPVRYRADNSAQWRSDPVVEAERRAEGMDAVFVKPDKWKPSIHMPRWASRITLAITGVRVERLQDISGDDCAAEGIKPDWDLFYEATEGADGWDEPEEFVEECEEECDWVNYGHRLVESSEHKEWERDRLNFALRLAFRELWQSINGPDSWSANPWCWVISFQRVQP